MPIGALTLDTIGTPFGTPQIGDASLYAGNTQANQFSPSGYDYGGDYAAVFGNPVDTPQQPALSFGPKTDNAQIDPLNTVVQFGYSSGDPNNPANWDWGSPSQLPDGTQQTQAAGAPVAILGFSPHELLLFGAAAAAVYFLAR